jgi:hypothetical protein
MPYTGAKKKKPTQKMKECSPGVCDNTQHKVPDRVEKYKKIKPKEVFGSNYDKKSKKTY